MISKIIYTDKMVAKQKEETAKAMETLEKAGKDFKEPPDYLSELHNRLALVTV